MMMRRLPGVVAAAAIVVLGLAGTAMAQTTSHASAAAPRWGPARQIPGLAALNKKGVAQVTALSCVSAGNCSAGGTYKDGSGRHQPFVVDEKNGTWGTAEEVPGIAALNKGSYSQVNELSCASAGNCAAVGYY